MIAVAYLEMRAFALDRHVYLGYFKGGLHPVMRIKVELLQQEQAAELVRLHELGMPIPTTLPTHPMVCHGNSADGIFHFHTCSN